MSALCKFNLNANGQSPQRSLVTALPTQAAPWRRPTFATLTFMERFATLTSRSGAIERVPRKGNEMRIYIHDQAARELRVGELDDQEVLAQLVERIGSHDGARVWAEGAEEPLAKELSALEAGLSGGDHVFIGKSTRINVTVDYNGEINLGELPPALTVRAVFELVTGPKHLNLSAAERATLELAVCGSEEAADEQEHIGVIATDDELCFDLRPKHVFEGER